MNLKIVFVIQGMLVHCWRSQNLVLLWQTFLLFFHSLVFELFLFYCVIFVIWSLPRCFSEGFAHFFETLQRSGHRVLLRTQFLHLCALNYGAFALPQILDNCFLQGFLSSRNTLQLFLGSQILWIQALPLEIILV